MRVSGFSNILGDLRLVMIIIIHVRMRESAILLLYSWLIQRRDTHVRVMRGLRRLLLLRIYLRGDLLLMEVWKRFSRCNWFKVLLEILTRYLFASLPLHWSFRLYLFHILWLNLFMEVYNHWTGRRIQWSRMHNCSQGWLQEWDNDLLTWKSPACQ